MHRFLIGLVICILTIVVVSIVRTPSIPDVPDSVFATPAASVGTGVRIGQEKIQELTSVVKQNQDIIELENAMMLSGIALSVHLNPDQSARIESAVSIIERSGVTSSGHSAYLRMNDLWAEFLGYSDIDKLLTIAFVWNNQTGDIIQATSLLEQRFRLTQSLLQSEEVDIAGFLVAWVSQMRLLGLVQKMQSASGAYQTYDQQIREWLVRMTELNNVYKKALLFDSEYRTNLPYEGAPTNPLWRALVWLYDAEYARKFYRKIYQLSLASTSVDEKREFYHSLPFCPTMNNRELSDESVLSEAYEKFTCVFDLRGEFATRLLINTSGVAIFSDIVVDEMKLRNQVFRSLSLPIRKYNRPKVRQHW